MFCKVSFLSIGFVSCMQTEILILINLINVLNFEYEASISFNAYFVPR
jgi:hypothetical protein